MDNLSELELPYLAQEPFVGTSPHPETPDGLRASLNQVGPAAKPFLHWHDSYDLVWLLAGRIWLTVDGGEENELAPGDLAVQHGANHSWRTGSDGALLGVFLVGAERTGATPPAAQRLDAGQLDPAPPLPFLQAPLADLLMRDPKLVVTGQREDGTSIFLHVGEAGPDFRSDGANGVLVHRLWANDSFLDRRELPFAGDVSPEHLRTSSRHAAPGGVRASLVKFLPSERGREFAFHWRDTIDFEWLLAGEMTLGLDDGSEVTLRPGDVVVQHGTNHSWRVGRHGAVVALVLLGVERRGVAPRAEDRAPRL